MEECKICKKQLKTIKSLAKHITIEHPDINREIYYETYISKESDVVCKMCGTRKRKFLSFSRGYGKYCGHNDCTKRSLATNDPVVMSIKTGKSITDCEKIIFDRNSLGAIKGRATMRANLEADPTYYNHSYRETPEYWIKQGHDVEEAKKLSKKYRKEKYEKTFGTRAQKERDNPEMYAHTRPQKKEYWLSKGFAEVEAKERARDRQNTGSLKKYIERHGEIEGPKKFKERQEKWQNTMKTKPAEELDRINKLKAPTLRNFVKKYGKTDGLKRYNSWIDKHHTDLFYSKESIVFFDKLLGELSLTNIEYLYKEQEFRLFDGDYTVYCYDFTLPDICVIIEYHGSCFHPNKDKLTESEWEEWKQLYSKEHSAEIVYKKDCLKRQLAEKSGYDYFVVWDVDDHDEKVKELTDIIQRKYEKN